MPPVFKYDTACGRLALWRITESEEQLCALVTAADAASCERMLSPARRLERLAWRALLRELHPGAGEVYYKEGGEPLAEGLPGHIGVSHCAGYAALMWSKAPCAVDIEPLARDFSRAAARYISPQERALPAAADPHFAAIAWCAKEAAYKLAATPGLDFLADIRITAATLPTGEKTPGTLSVTVRGEALPAFGVLLREGLCLVFTENC